MSRATGLRLIAAVVTGIAFRLTSPEIGAWWLAFVGWIPWLWAVDGQTPRRSALYGLVAGATATFFGFSWLVEVLARFAEFPTVPAYLVLLLFALAQGLQWAGASALLAALQRRTGRSILLLTPLAWAAGEAFAPALFPVYTAIAWWDHPRWLQLAELGGPILVGAAMLAINAAAYVLMRERTARAAVVLAGLSLALPAYGTWRMAATDALVAASPTARFGVVQGNFGLKEWSASATRGSVLARLQAETARLEPEDVDVLVWGENVYPYWKTLPHEGGEDAALWDFHRIRIGFTAPLVFGAITAEPSRDLPLSTANPYGWNSALVLNPDDSFGDRYDKVHPLWFGEYAPPPLDPAWYVKTVKGASHVNAGVEPTVLRAGQWRLGPMICYEDILPRFGRSVASMGVHAYVNLTSDTWFGRSAEQGQHLALAVLRAIEGRRALVRAVDAGPSAVVDPAGRIVTRLGVTNPDEEGPAEPESFVADVPMIDPGYRTPYVRFGEWFTGLVVVGIVGLVSRGRAS